MRRDDPWVSPVWFAPAGYTEFFWVSSPERLHSRNVAARPEVSIVIFDSRVPIGTGQAVYMSARAEEVPRRGRPGDRDLSRRSAEQGGREWTAEDVRPPAPYRLYRATAGEHWVLDPEGGPDRRVPVALDT